jgi:uncharacterized membrane protein
MSDSGSGAEIPSENAGDGSQEPSRSDGGIRDNEELPQSANVADLMDELRLLEERVDDPVERAHVQRTIQLADRVPGGKTFGKQIDKYTGRDIAEAFVGSILISLPMLVEDGVFAIGDHFVTQPAFFVANAAFVVVMTIGLLYWADIQEVKRSKPILGIVPRRLAGVLSIAFFTAAFTMTLWGRVDWSAPWVALCHVSVVWSAAAFGGALGDILPGESKGNDLTLSLDR